MVTPSTLGRESAWSHQIGEAKQTQTELGGGGKGGGLMAESLGWRVEGGGWRCGVEGKGQLHSHMLLQGRAGVICESAGLGGSVVPACLMVSGAGGADLVQSRLQRTQSKQSVRPSLAARIWCRAHAPCPGGEEGLPCWNHRGAPHPHHSATRTRPA